MRRLAAATHAKRHDGQCCNGTTGHVQQDLVKGRCNSGGGEEQRKAGVVSAQHGKTVSNGLMNEKQGNSKHAQPTKKRLGQLFAENGKTASIYADKQEEQEKAEKVGILPTVQKREKSKKR